MSRLALACAVMVLFSACGTLNTAHDPLTLAKESMLKPVMISVTSNTNQISGIDEIIVQRLSQAQLNVESG